MTVGNSKRSATGVARHRGPDDGAIEELVRLAIVELLPTDPTILAVATRLSVNVRTLQRRLAHVSSNFRTLLDECRRQQAERQLEHTDLSVSEVSRRLGYSDPAHFVRAFRRWTGQTPTRFGSRAEGRRD